MSDLLFVMLCNRITTMSHAITFLFLKGEHISVLQRNTFQLQTCLTFWSILASFIYKPAHELLL